MQKVNIFIQPTSRCDRNCWFCEADCIPEGIDIDPEIFWEFGHALEEERCKNNFEIPRLTFSGGEPLMHPMISTFIRMAGSLQPLDLILQTSGPNNDEELNRLKEIVETARKLDKGIVVDDKGEEFEIRPVRLMVQNSVHYNKKSYQRFIKCLDAEIPILYIMYRENPIMHLNHRIKNIYDFLSIIEKHNYYECLSLINENHSPELISLANYYLRSGYYGTRIVANLYEMSDTVWRSKIDWNSDNPNEVYFEFPDAISPRGRAKKILGHLKSPWNDSGQGLCETLRHFLTNGLVELWIDWNGKLSYCCDDCGLKYDLSDLHEVLESAQLKFQEAIRIMLTNLDDKIWSPCDICPFNKKPIPEIILP